MEESNSRQPTKHGLGSPLPRVSTPRGLYSQESQLSGRCCSAGKYQQNSIVHLYSSRTASPIYTAEQRRPCIYFSRKASPWEWRSLGVAARHPKHHVSTICHQSRAHIYVDNQRLPTSRSDMKMAESMSGSGMTPIPIHFLLSAKNQQGF